MKIDIELLIAMFLLLGVFYFLVGIVTELIKLRRDLVTQRNYEIYTNEASRNEKTIDNLKATIEVKNRDIEIAQNLWLQNLSPKGLFISPRGIKFLNKEPDGIVGAAIDEVDGKEEKNAE